MYRPCGSIPIHRLEPRRPSKENLLLPLASRIRVRVQITRTDRLWLNCWNLWIRGLQNLIQEIGGNRGQTGRFLMFK